MSVPALRQTINNLIFQNDEINNDLLLEKIDINREREEALESLRAAEAAYVAALKVQGQRSETKKRKAAARLAQELEDFHRIDPNRAKALTKTMTLPRPEHLSANTVKKISDELIDGEAEIEQSVEDAGPRREVEFKKEIKSTDGKWTSWSDEARKVYAREAGKKFTGVTVGPGEASIVVEFGAKVMGSSVDYDIEQNAKRWEVKEVDRDRLRTSIHGIVASAEPRFRLNVIFKKIQNVVGKLLKDAELLEQLSEEAREAVEELTQFISSEMESIFSKSEITKKRFTYVAGALDNAAILYDALLILADRGGRRYNAVTIGRKTYQVRAAQFQKILAALGAEEDIDVGSVLESDKVMRRAAKYSNELEDDALLDPGSFIADLSDNMSPGNTFSNVDGLILVNPKGYLIMTTSELNDALDFDGLTQGGRSFYKVTDKYKSK